MEEIWKDISGYEGLYQVSNLGRVKSFRECTKHKKPKEFILKPSLINTGYETVTLYSDKNKQRRKYQIHRLVAIEFIPNPENFPCVNHKDENKVNNCVENLEWCTYEYNNNYGTAKIRSIDARSKGVRQKTLSGETIATYKSSKVACALFGYEIGTFKYWCRMGFGGGYKWEYI